MADQQPQPQQPAPNARSPLFQRRQHNRRPQVPAASGGHYPQHQSHIQFISSTPMPNPRQLFQDSSRARRAFHNANGGGGAAGTGGPGLGGATGTPYGAINSSPMMRINTAAGTGYQGSNHLGPLTPKPKQVPLRTTKVSQKLVLLPEDQEETEEDDDEYYEGPFADQLLSPFADETEFRGRRRGLHGRAATRSEMLTKEQRNARGLARVVAYCTAEGYDQKRLAAYLKANHGVYPRLYDEALYAAYHFPLVPGKVSKLMSGPPMRSPGGGSILDKQLERYEENTGDDYTHPMENEESEYRRPRSHLELDEEDEAIGSASGRRHGSSSNLKSRHRNSSRSTQSSRRRHRRSDDEDPIESTVGASEQEMGAGEEMMREQQDYFDTGADMSESHPDHLMSPQSSSEDQTVNPDTVFTPTRQNSGPGASPFMGGEVFFFDYGVTVFWNMTVEQETWILEDLAQFELKRLIQEDVQTEEFHFEYARNATPRIYNDMITLRGGNHMIKLTISHAISQSVKLALYECQMDDTIDDTKIIPMQLAQTGKLNYSRPQITRISGHLFQLRMNVDLVSNVLDTPEIFWSEPELQPLYDAIRGYLEISQRAKVLSDRCAVISDLLTMLRDDLASNNMNYITWIIIILIVIAVIVAAGEIVVKYLSHFGPESAEIMF
ncbi:hypothetical protein BGW38_003501 [Lunasporangiospora selenospora]|uniref:DUF155 domain-containing protein n=1 Tax=Lunasporangiospora selenospora TaxID=979761 RepID=A0A9P6KC60_9FUNG|nr:hypothetical protein BGW38_003501 [Lunasporangiospora selenospora]